MLELLTRPLAQRLTLTLLHFVWQGFAVMLALQLSMAVFRVRRANTRYALSLAALAVMAMCPLLTYVLIADVSSESIAATRDADAIGGPIGSAPASVQTGRPALLHGHSEPSRLQSEMVRLVTMPPPGRSWFRDRIGSFVLIDRYQPYMLAIWLSGVLVFGMRLTTGFAWTLWVRGDRRAISDDLACRIDRLYERMGIAGAARMFASNRVRQAMAVGFWRPVVLLPLSWLAELPPQALDAIIAHELAHIRRWDLWMSLCQRILETSLFYHPAVWWLSRRVTLEREMCCDEMALAATGGRVVYAGALNLAARLVVRSPQPTLAASFLGEKKMDLLDRVRNILGAGVGGDGGRWWPVGVAAVVLPLAIWCVLTTLPSGRGTAALADEREGQRVEGERDAPEGARERGDSPEARARREGDREREASPEARERREGDRPRESPEARAPREGDGGREREGSPGDRFRAPEGDRNPMADFRPQTEREAALFRMVQQLQQELMQLRREVGQMRGGPPPRDMAPPRRDPVGPSDRPDLFRGDRKPEPRGPVPPRGEADRERAQQISIFIRYDKNDDKKVTLDEFLAMREGSDRPEVRAQWERVFIEGDRNRDRTWTLEEFLAAAQRRREGGDQPREGDRPRTDAPREGDRPRTDAPRDGDRPRTDAPRDGDRPRTDAPRDGDRPRTDAPRDGDRPRTDAPRDGDRPQPDAPREGAPREGDRDR